MGLGDTSAQIGNAGGWSITSTNPVAIHFAGKHVATYNPGIEEGKPFFYPLIGPTGQNMTRHWPQTALRKGEADDHIQHRGIWYGLGNVNGLDFWRFPGPEKGRSLGRIVNNETDALVMQDTREFTFSHTKAGGLVLDAKITLLASQGDVLIKDEEECGWSIRVPATMRLEGEVARGGILNSNGTAGKDTWGKRAQWVHYFGPDEKGHPAGIAVLDHPSNLRHPTWWHARHYGLFTANPFGQGNFEEESEKGAGDHVIKKGESLSFRYRTIFHAGDKNTVDLKAEFDAFSKE